MFRDIVIKIKNIFIALLIAFTSITSVFAQESKEAFIQFNINVPEYLQIDTITSAVLTANVTDRTGNLYTPLASRFKVVSNCQETKTLYLKAEAITDNGSELSMFLHGGRVYVAFTNAVNTPRSSALANCKMGSHPKESPGVVAYPVTSIIGAKTKFNPGLGKYEVYIENGITNIAVNIGSNVLRNSFDKNDPMGFYQATLFLTESDI